MSKYRVVKEGNKYYIEWLAIFLWTKLDRAYGSKEGAIKAIQYLKRKEVERKNSKVVYED